MDRADVAVATGGSVSAGLAVGSPDVGMGLEAGYVF
jgi:hypothetical protein